MKVNLWTKNNAKKQAVQELNWYFDWFNIEELNCFDVSSQVDEQPRTMHEIILWAKNRARAAYEFWWCDISIWIEDGIIPVPETLSWWTNLTACVVYDWEKFHPWIGWGFEYPKIVIDRVLKTWEDLSCAFKNLGFTQEDKIWNNWWIVGYVSDGKLTRADKLKPTIIFALLQLNKKDLY